MAKRMSFGVRGVNLPRVGRMEKAFTAATDNDELIARHVILHPMRLLAGSHKAALNAAHGTGLRAHSSP